MVLGLVLLFVGAGQRPRGGETDAELATLLRAKDQALLTAVHRGGRAVWERLTTPDFLYVEEGSVTGREEFLKELEPDFSEPLQIREYRVHRSGDTAIVVHRDDVPLTAEDLRRGGQYLMTEAWQRIGGEWRLRVVHIDAVRTDPPEVALTAAQADEMVGAYRHGEETYRIRRDGRRLVGVREGQAETELKAETRDVLFVAGNTRTRRVFQRDTAGKVTGFVRRDENTDVLWRRVR